MALVCLMACEPPVEGEAIVIVPSDPMADGGPPDALDRVDGAPAAACAIRWDTPPPAEAGPGSRLGFEAPPGADAAWVGDDGLAIHADADRPDHWWLRLPYRGGPFELTFDVTCPDGATQSHPLATTVRPLRWTATPTWREGEDGPPGREYFSMWIDPVEPDQLWVYGGFHYRPAQFTPADDLWVRDLTDGTWRAVEQDPSGPLVGGAGLAPIPGTRTAVHFGGVTFGGGSSDLPPAVDRLDVGQPVARWAPQPFTEPVEAGAYQPALFYDPERAALVAFGGQGLFGASNNLTVFPLDGGAWSRLDSTRDPRPAPRVGFAWAFADGRLVIFSGEQGPQPDGRCTCADDTWLLDLRADPPAWSRLDSPAQPAGRRNAVYGLDPVEQRLFVWGGTADGRTSVPGLSVLHFARGGEAWVTLEPEGEAPIRSSGRAVHDAPRGRMLFGFGNGDAGVMTDLWSLSL